MPRLILRPCHCLKNAAHHVPNRKTLPSRRAGTKQCPVSNGALSLALILAAAFAEHRLFADEVASRDEISATFSIVAVDPESGIVGAAVASKYPAVGKVVPYVRAGVGGFCTQHYHVPKWGEPALDMLAKGTRPEKVLANLLADDDKPEMRQLAIIDMAGRAAVHNPTAAPKDSRYWGAMTGRYYCCQGNTLTGREVVAALASAYEETQGSLADRLMAALIAADCAGGDHRGRLAAGIRVAKRDVEGYWFELHVDKSDDAVLDLAKKYAESKHDAKGSWRGGQLPFVHPCPKRKDPKAPDK
jgi:uncharacterized Ntn-hydrolase superfamily protein